MKIISHPKQKTKMFKKTTTAMNLKKIACLVPLLLVQPIFGQTTFSGGSSRIPGLSSGGELGISSTSNDHYDTLMLSYIAGTPNTKTKPSFFEFEGGGAIGATNINDPEIDPFLNLELTGGTILKYEWELGSDHHLIPFLRAGLTLNYLDNTQETTVGYSPLYVEGGDIYQDRYYYTTGTSFLDIYGHASAGLSYIAPNEKFAVSTEFGSWNDLTGDLTELTKGISPTSWNTQIFFKTNEKFGIKLFYTSVKIGDFNASTVGTSICFKF